jgi:zinc transport system permease protein
MDELYAATAPTWADFVAGWDMGLYGPPILCAVLAGLTLGYLGVFVVLRRMVFITAAVSQAAGLGVALSFWASIHLGMEISPVVGALALALLVTAIVSLPAGRLRLSRESILGAAYLACWALAVLVGDRIVQEAHDIASILFGSAVLVRDVDVYLVGGVAALVFIVQIFAHRGFVFAAFDPTSARVQGIPVRSLDLVSWVLVAITVSVSTRALGVLPVFAFAVLPAMAALALVNRLRWALPVAALLGAVSGGAGYLFAFFYEFPVGASQAAVALALFVLVVPIRLLRRGGIAVAR